MRQLLVTLPCFISVIWSYAQPFGNIDHYKTTKFEVAIFPMNAGVLADTSLKRFTPIRDEIDKAEGELQKQISKTHLDSNWSDTINYTVLNDPLIQTNYGEYKKQYFGYIDSVGNRILLINCFWNRSDYMDSNDLKFPNTVPWGGSYIWNVKYNLTLNKFFDYIWGSSIVCYSYNGIYHFITKDINVAIFPKKVPPEYVGKGYQGFTPTKEEVVLAEKNLLKPRYLNDKNHSDSNFISSHLILYKRKLNYRRQYFGYINKNGHKILFINCFCEEDKGTPNFFENLWLTHEVIASDGGSCFWSVRYDLGSGIFFDLQINNSE